MDTENSSGQEYEFGKEQLQKTKGCPLGQPDVLSIIAFEITNQDSAGRQGFYW